MGYLNYQFWTRRFSISAQDDLLRELVGSGTVQTSGTMSAPIPVPVIVSGSPFPELVGVFEVYGPQPVYVHLRKAGGTAAAGTGTHASADAQPRMLLREADGSVSVNVPQGGTFAAVDAAAFS